MAPVNFVPRSPTPPSNMSECGSGTSSLPAYRSIVTITTKKKSRFPVQLPNTPDPSSDAAIDYLSSKLTPRGTKRKRVVFIEPDSLDAPSSPPSLPDLPTENDVAKDSTPLYVPTRGGKPGKSILKKRKLGQEEDNSWDSDDLNISLDSSSPVVISNRVKMIGEACVQLNSADKGARLDAYQSLSGAMKKHDDLPKLDAFLERVPPLMDAVLRDLRARKGDDHRDGQLTLEALKLAALITWRNPKTLTENARVDVLNWCIEVLEDNSATKIITNNTLYLLTVQSFSKLNSNQRAHKIIKALETIHNRVSGNQVKLLRLSIYGKMATQSQAIMSQLATHWLVPLFEELLSDKKENYEKAIAIGRTMAISLGSQVETSRAFETLLNMSIPHRPVSGSPRGINDFAQTDPRCYMDFLEEKLYLLTADKARPETVPKIWSIMILLLQRRRSVITKSPHKKQFLGILQHCLNRVTTQTKSSAIIAWRDLVFVLHNEMHTDPAILDLLGALFVRSFQRNDGPKVRSDAESTLCTYLYYALWPRASQDTITRVWRKQIAFLLDLNSSKNQIDAGFALRVLGALFGNQTQVAWDENKALDAPLHPEDIPRIEPKWIASNTDLVLKIFDSHLMNASEDGEIFAVWKSFNKCIVENGHHEIRPSTTTMNAMAGMMTYALSHAAKVAETDDEESNVKALADVCGILGGTFSTFGQIPCNEKALWVDGNNVVHAFDSPGKSADAPEDKSSALDLTLSMLITSDCTFLKEPPSTFKPLMATIIERKLESYHGRSKRLRCLADLAQLCKCEITHIHESEEPTHCLKAVLWHEICQSLQGYLTQYASQQTSPDSQSRGAHFKQAVSILARGIDQAVVDESLWRLAFSSLLSEARDTLLSSTHLAIAVGIIEPLARDIVHHISQADDNRAEIKLTLICEVLESARWPDQSDTQAQAQKSLWGAATASTKAVLEDPYSELYTLFSTTLNLDISLASQASIERVIFSFLDSLPTQFFWPGFAQIAKSLGDWLSAKNSAEVDFTCWSRIASVIQDNWSARPANSVAIIEPIMMAALSSADPAVAPEYLKLWNELSGTTSVDGEKPSSELESALKLALEPPTAINNVEPIFSQISDPVAPAATPSRKSNSSGFRGSPSRREWVLSKPESPPARTQHAETAYEDALSQVKKPTPNKLPSAEPALGIDIAMSRVQAIEADDEMPSSPPELPKDPELPVMAESDDVDVAMNEDPAEIGLPMSDEFDHMDSSPTPYTRRPMSAVRSDVGVFDVPDVSPMKGPVYVRGNSVPAPSTRRSSSSRREFRAGIRSIASKHFPIAIEDDSAERNDVSHAKFAEVNSPVAPDVKPVVEASPTKQQKSKQPEPEAAMAPIPEIIDIDALPEKRTTPASNKRRQSSISLVQDQQPQAKRPRGRPRKNPQQTPVSSQDSVVENTPVPQKRGRGRPRKNPITPTPAAPATKVRTPIVVISNNEDDDIEDSITVASSAPARRQEQTLAKRRKSSRGKGKSSDNVQKHIAVPSSDIEPSDRDARSARRAAREQSTSSVEVVKESFIGKSPPKVKAETTNVVPPISTSPSPDSRLNNRKEKSLKRRASALDAADQNNTQDSLVAHPVEPEPEHESELARSAVHSPSSQLLEVEPKTPKRRKIEQAEKAKAAITPSTPSSPLSQKAQEILASLRGLLGNVQRAVFGRGEAREIQKTLNEISATVPVVGDAVLEAEERGQEEEV